MDRLRETALYLAIDYYERIAKVSVHVSEVLNCAEDMARYLRGERRDRNAGHSQKSGVGDTETFLPYDPDTKERVYR